MRHNTMKDNTIRYYTTQCDKIQDNVIQHDTIGRWGGLRATGHIGETTGGMIEKGIQVSRVEVISGVISVKKKFINGLR